MGLILLIPSAFYAQTPELIHWKNPSFHAPTKYFVIPPGWSPQIIFLAGKKIKELALTRFHRKEERSQKGDTHIALACYENGTRENLGQKLKFPVIQGHVYSVDIWLAFSPVRTPVHPSQHNFYLETNLKPAKLQIFGFKSGKDMTNSLLAETGPINHPEWKKYTLQWISPGKYQYLYLVPSWTGDGYYNGNILVDNLSDIRVSIINNEQ